ncbi:MAG TPA: methylenetetrahydrofolate reductase [Treponemataceae bacterium]|nr:methylenetetrahydrofolate reductase [Treponemataceae bacterium]
MRIAVELDPPAGNATGDALSFLCAGALALAEAGADCITMADNPRAVARGDSIALGALTQVMTGIPVIPHITCRDRNLNAIRSGLCALDMAGINEVLAVTGDPVRAEDLDRIGRRAEFHSADLARYIGEWNLYPDLFSRHFTVSAALNINAPNFDAELRRADVKARCGVTRFYTQPVLSREGLRNIEKAKRTLGQELYGGILPIVSEKNALFLAGGIRGIRVGDDVMDLYRGVGKDESSALAINVSTEYARAMRNDVTGFYVITPFKRIDLVKIIVNKLKNAECVCEPNHLIKAP